MKAILFDASLCNGCYGCQMACKDEHCGNSWLPIAAEQPMTGEYVRGKTQVGVARKGNAKGNQGDAHYHDCNS